MVTAWRGEVLRWCSQTLKWLAQALDWAILLVNRFFSWLGKKIKEVSTFCGRRVHLIPQSRRALKMAARAFTDTLVKEMQGAASDAEIAELKIIMVNGEDDIDLLHED